VRPALGGARRREGLAPWLGGLRSALAVANPFHRPPTATRPGAVVELRGIIFQSDGRSRFGEWIIRPFAKLDRLVAGIETLSTGAPSLAMHAALHVVLDVDGQRRDYVVEQIVASPYAGVHNGISWTPLEEFRRRDRGGWDTTLPPQAFRAVDAAAVEQAIGRLNRIDGRPFIKENCVNFIERVFGCRRMFADSPLLHRLGLNVAVKDPALPLLRSDAQLDTRTRHLLRVDALARLPDAIGRATPDRAGDRVAAVTLTIAASLCGAAIGRGLADRRA
jgi:hypothetical protein